MIPEEPATDRDMVLNLSVRINETQTQEIIRAKRDLYFKFIEQQVIVLRYQVGQERNYETKGAMKTDGGERTLHRKKATSTRTQILPSSLPDRLQE